MQSGIYVGLSAQIALEKRVGPTDNTLAVGMAGDGWFAYQTPQGVVYTRDGRMQMTAEGELRTMNGYPMMDPGGATLVLDPNGGEPWIGADGSITQDGRAVGSIGVFQIPNEAK